MAILHFLLTTSVHGCTVDMLERAFDQQDYGLISQLLGIDYGRTFQRVCLSGDVDLATMFLDSGKVISYTVADIMSQDINGSVSDLLITYALDDAKLLGNMWVSACQGGNIHAIKSIICLESFVQTDVNELLRMDLPQIYLTDKLFQLAAFALLSDESTVIEKLVIEGLLTAETIIPLMSWAGQCSNPQVVQKLLLVPGVPDPVINLTLLASLGCNSAVTVLLLGEDRALCKGHVEKILLAACNRGLVDIVQFLLDHPNLMNSQHLFKCLIKITESKLMMDPMNQSLIEIVTILKNKLSLIEAKITFK